MEDSTCSAFCSAIFAIVRQQDRTDEQRFYLAIVTKPVAWKAALSKAKGDFLEGGNTDERMRRVGVGLRSTQEERELAD